MTAVEKTSQKIRNLSNDKQTGLTYHKTYNVIVRRHADSNYELIVSYPIPESHDDDYDSWNCGCPLRRTSHLHKSKTYTGSVSPLIDDFAAACSAAAKNGPVDIDGLNRLDR